MRVSLPFRTAVLILALAAALPLSAGSRSKEHLRTEGTPGISLKGPFSDYIESAIDDDTGQFTIGIPGGAILLYGHPSPWSSYATVKVDGTDYVQGDGWTLVQAPANSGSVNRGVWRLGSSGVEVRQIITLVSGFSTGNPDTYLIEYEVVNSGNSAHQIGIRLMLDTMLGSNDGAPFQVPGTGSVISEQEWLDDEMPFFFFVFNDLQNPDVTAQGSLIGGQVGVPPDIFQIASWSGIYGAPFEYTVNTALGFSDSAYAVYWTDRTLGPGESFTGSTYYGLGGLSVDSGPPLVSSLLAPVFLDCADGIVSPNPFQVALYLENSSAEVTDTVQDISATLSVPQGLIIPAGSQTQSLPDMAHDDNLLISWSVLADGTVRGDISYQITIASGNHGSKQHVQAVNVPADCDMGDLPPVVAITSPASGSTLDCRVTLVASAQDDDGVARVQFYADGEALEPPDITEPFTYDLDTGLLENGPHTFMAVATDTADQSSESNEVTVTVANPKITWVKYKNRGKKLKVFGEDFHETDAVSVQGVRLETTFKEKYRSLYKDPFNKIKDRWFVEGSAGTGTSDPDLIPGGGDSYAVLDPDSSMAVQVGSEYNTNIRVRFHYRYQNMNDGEGVYLEYALAGPQGPWFVAYSDLADRDDTTTVWKKAEADLPSGADDNPELWIRVRNVVNPYDDYSGKYVSLDAFRVDSVREMLKGSGAPAIGHAQTVEVSIIRGDCTTAPYHFTRP